jgi:hypothetical protein
MPASNNTGNETGYDTGNNTGNDIARSTAWARASTRVARTPWVVPFVLFVVALALRLAVSWHFRAESVWDGHYYDYYAKRIAAGHGYSDERWVEGVDVGRASCHYPVGYSAFLGAFYFIFGTSRSSTVAFNSLVGALLVVAVYAFAHRTIGARRAAIAGLLTCLHPGLVLYAALTMSEPLAALWTLVSFLAALSARGVLEAHNDLTTAWPGDRATRRSYALRLAGVGASLGIAALIRPPALFAAPFLAWAAWPRSSKGNASAPGLAGLSRLLRIVRSRAAATLLTTFAIGFAALLTIAPWTARNCAKMDGCALISTNGGWNLAIGSFARATGRFETLRSSDGCREVSGQVQQDRCWLAFGLREIREHPLRWLRLVPKKWSYTLDHESFQVEYLHEAAPARWPEPTRAAARQLLSLVHQLLVAFALFSVVPSPLSNKLARQPHDERHVRGGDHARVPADANDARTNRRSRGVFALLFAVALGACYLGMSQNPVVVWPLACAGLVVFTLQTMLRRVRNVGVGYDKSAFIMVALSWSAVLGLLGTHAVFFGEDRYHIVASPFLCLLASAAFRARVG